MEFLLLLSHCSPRLMHYSCYDLAAAAILSSLSPDSVAYSDIGFGIESLDSPALPVLPVLLTERVRSCATRIRGIVADMPGEDIVSFRIAAAGICKSA